MVEERLNRNVHNPQHYGGDTPYETIKVIEAWELDFHLGNAVKYISRAEHKGKYIEDLEKAIWYVKRAIEKHKKEVESNTNTQRP